jgi:phospholipid-transporting ATPase
MNPNFYDIIEEDENIIHNINKFVFQFLTWLIAICNMLPISLLVTIEMIKFCQAIFISWDAKMYDKENNRTAIVQSSALNEELGQVHEIFTDKTGTLTKNIMEFKYMVIGEYQYGSDQRMFYI